MDAPQPAAAPPGRAAARAAPTVIDHLALAVFACAPQVLGGVRLRGPATPQRDAWIAALRACLPPDMPLRRVPLHAGGDALDASLDLAATLATGRAVQRTGVIAELRGGVALLAMAERVAPVTASRLSAALDAGELAVVALDEGDEPDEAPPAALCERLALHVEPVPAAEAPDPAALAQARARWRDVACDDAWLRGLVATGEALGVPSARAAWQALCAARIIAALDGRDRVEESDAASAAALVIAPRATRMPPPPPAEDAAPPPPPPPPPDDTDSTEQDHEAPDSAMEDRLIEAAAAALPPGLLAHLMAGLSRSRGAASAGRSGQASWARVGGCPAGAVRGVPRGGARLALIDTLRAAAPWQRVRQAADAAPHTAAAGAAPRLKVTRDDLHVQRRIRRRGTTTIFAIDASGSQALTRLAEAKGAVELLLADCYARRDRVAVIGFRGDSAELLLAPTRSLVRAKRQLAGLPGGGGTPLAAGLDAATAAADAARRAGGTPLVVLLTDGRANIARDGSPGREGAARDALASGRALASRGIASLVIDTSAQPGEAARRLAAAMDARCVVLPHAQADALSVAVRGERGRLGGSHGRR